QQLLAPAWELDAAGRRKVEPKDETKEKIGRSPDDADAFNLAHYEAPLAEYAALEPEPRRLEPAGDFRERRGGHLGHPRGRANMNREGDNALAWLLGGMLIGWMLSSILVHLLFG